MEDLLFKPLMHVMFVLAAGSAIRIVRLRGGDRATVRRKLGSLLVWWVLLVALFGVTSVGRPAAALLISAGALLAWREYVPWVAAAPADRRSAMLAGILILLNMAVILGPHPRTADWFLPVVGTALVSWSQAVQGRTDGFLRSTAGICWGLLVFGYALGHMVRFWDLPEQVVGEHGAVGWFLYVFILTQTNDIAQALVGRRWGRHWITPAVSPHKTWEGFLGGMVLTSCVSALIGPALTSLAEPATVWYRHSAATPAFAGAVLGIVLSATGFLGDIVMSSTKRDVGVKDSGRLLPGQGGVIDRIDSLTMTGMTMYWILRLMGGTA